MGDASNGFYDVSIQTQSIVFIRTPGAVALLLAPLRRLVFCINIMRLIISTQCTVNNQPFDSMSMRYDRFRRQNLQGRCAPGQRRSPQDNEYT